MIIPNGVTYYISRRADLLRRFEQYAQEWASILARADDDDSAAAVIRESRARFEALIPHMPYIGGDENHLTGEVIRAASVLAFYRAMQAHGKSMIEVGKVLYDAAEALPPEPPIPPSWMLTPEQLMERRRERAARSQQRRYPGDYVYEFVAGDGDTFDYGYNFWECATHKFFVAQGAAELAPFYCFLDFPLSRAAGSGLTRTHTLAEGHPCCDHRFKQGRRSEPVWPPPFLTET
jgi:hypothetical protein